MLRSTNIDARWRVQSAMARNDKWIAGLAGALVGMALSAILAPKRTNRRQTEVSSPEPIRALPAPELDEDSDQGQANVILALAILSVIGGTILLAYLVPPAFFAPGIAFGGLVLGGLAVGIAHIRTMKFRAGDPPS